MHNDFIQEVIYKYVSDDKISKPFTSLWRTSLTKAKHSVNNFAPYFSTHM